jgi:hypothetical protein
MRAREWLYEARDPKVVALQRDLRKAGALNVEGPYLGEPLRVDGKDGPNTRYNMDLPQFAGIVRQHKNPSAPHARNTVADADSLKPGEELVPPTSADLRAATSHVQTGIDPSQPTNPLKGVTGTAASPLPSLALAPGSPEDDYVAPHTAPKGIASTVTRPAMPRTPTPIGAIQAAAAGGAGTTVPPKYDGIDPIVRARMGMPPATTAEIDAYMKAHPPVVGNLVSGDGTPVQSGGAKEVERAARQAAKEYETKQGQNPNINNNTRDTADAQVKSNMAKNETGGNFDITFGDYLDPKTNTIKNGKYKTVAQWSQETLGTPLQLTQLTLDQVKAFQRYKNSVATDSGAVGAYQFMPSTLFDPTGQVAQMKIPMTAKFDQQLQDKIYDHYSAENDRVLKANKVPLTPGNRYMAHYLGPSGAAWVYSAAKTDPDKTIANVITSHGNKDPSPRNPELAILTAGEMPEIMAKRMAGDIGYGRPTKEQFAALGQRKTQLAVAKKPKPAVA